MQKLNSQTFKIYTVLMATVLIGMLFVQRAKATPRISGDLRFIKPPFDECDSLTTLGEQVVRLLKGEACYVYGNDLSQPANRGRQTRQFTEAAQNTIRDYDRLLAEIQYVKSMRQLLASRVGYVAAGTAVPILPLLATGHSDLATAFTITAGITGTIAAAVARLPLVSVMEDLLSIQVHSIVDLCFLSVLRNNNFNVRNIEQATALVAEARRIEELTGSNLSATERLHWTTRVRRWFSRSSSGQSQTQQSAPPLDCSPESRPQETPLPSVAANPTGVRVAVPPSVALDPLDDAEEVEHGHSGSGTSTGNRFSACLVPRVLTQPLRVPSWFTSLLNHRDVASAPTSMSTAVSECSLAQVREAALPLYRQATSDHRLAVQGLSSMVNEFAAPAIVITLGTSSIATTSVRMATSRLMQGATFRIASGSAATSYVLATTRARAQGFESPLLLRGGPSHSSAGCVAEESNFCSVLSSLIREPGQPCEFSEAARGIWEYGPARCADATAALNQVLTASGCAGLPIRGE